MHNQTLQNEMTDYQLVMSKFIHEIRNPLTLVDYNLQTLISTHPETEDWKEVCNVQENLTYIKNLINEFSDYNNAGRISIKSTDITALLCNISDSFRSMFHYLGIKFIINISPELPHIPIDGLRLRQAIINILKNAEESITHTHGEIILSAKAVPYDATTALLISVTDNGCGIDPSHLSELGTPFITHKEKGTGLGLSVTKQIVEAHKGTVKIESSLSKGTSIHLYLPYPRMVE